MICIRDTSVTALFSYLRAGYILVPCLAKRPFYDLVKMQENNIKFAEAVLFLKHATVKNLCTVATAGAAFQSSAIDPALITCTSSVVWSLALTHHHSHATSACLWLLTQQ